MKYGYWIPSTNFGDTITPFLFPGIVYDHSREKRHIIGSGSILNHANENSVVWGAGVAWDEEVINGDCEILGVRGPVTAEICKAQGIKAKPIGDPGYLLPELVSYSNLKSFTLGIVPHYVDTHLLTEVVDPSINVINVLRPVGEVVREIAKCQAVLSSSLHGLIVSDALGIPSAWCEFSDEVMGDGTKFNDHNAFVGRDAYEPYDLRDLDLQKAVPKDAKLPNTDKLKETCPIPGIF